MFQENLQRMWQRFIAQPLDLTAAGITIRHLPLLLIA